MCANILTSMVVGQ